MTPMTTLRISKWVSILIFIFGATSGVTAQSTYFEAGVGFFPYLTWGSVVDNELSGYSTSRLQIDLDVHLGMAITRELYFVAGYDGVADELFLSGTFVNQISASLLSAGIRAYPFAKGLVLGADAGFSFLNGFVALGSGLAASIAWDFSPLGLNFEVGASAIYLSFDYSNPSFVLGVMPFVAVVMR